MSETEKNNIDHYKGRDLRLFKEKNLLDNYCKNSTGIWHAVYTCRKMVVIILFIIPVLFTACQPKTIEQQVEKLIKTNSWRTQEKIACALADSLNPLAVELIAALSPQEYSAETVFRSMLERYKEIVNEECIKEDFASDNFISRSGAIRVIKAYECIGIIPLQEAGEFLGIQTAGIYHPHVAFKVIKNIPIERREFALIEGLKTETQNTTMQDSLICEIKALYNTIYNTDIEAMQKLIALWEESQYAQGFQRAVASYGQEVVNYLCLDIEGNAELLARLGETSLATLISKMKNKDVAVRYAAAEALVLMTQYEPRATSNLMNAFDNSNLGIIADNYPFYIRLGRVGTEPLLLKALRYRFSKKMCIDYLNCNNEILESGATDIAYENGYSVYKDPYDSYDGPIWGSGN